MPHARFCKPGARPRRKPGGFTLLELLVAVTLLGVLAMLGWRGLDSMLRTRGTLEARAARTEGLRQLFSQFETDCAQLAAPELLQLVPLQIDESHLLLVRERNEIDRPSQWQVVQYRLRDGQIERDASAALRNSSELDAALLTLRSDAFVSAAATTGIQRNVLIDGMTGMGVRVWLGRAGWVSNDDELYSGVTGPGLAIGRPAGAEPAAIRAIELTLTADGGVAYNKVCLTGR